MFIEVLKVSRGFDDSSERKESYSNFVLTCGWRYQRPSTRYDLYFKSESGLRMIEKREDLLYWIT